MDDVFGVVDRGRDRMVAPAARGLGGVRGAIGPTGATGSLGAAGVLVGSAPLGGTSYAAATLTGANG